MALDQQMLTARSELINNLQKTEQENRAKLDQMYYQVSEKDTLINQVRRKGIWLALLMLIRFLVAGKQRAGLEGGGVPQSIRDPDIQTDGGEEAGPCHPASEGATFAGFPCASRSRRAECRDGERNKWSQKHPVS